MGFAALLTSVLVGLANGLASTDTITWGGDNTRAGYQTNHNMDPAVVRSSEWGQLFKTDLPGNYKGYKEVIYSQPLVYTPSGGDTQYVYVTTTQNNVYKLDSKTGAIIASRNLKIPFLTADLDGCVDINPTVGAIGTGVIDPDDGTYYVIVKTYENQESQEPQGRPAGRHFIFAIDVNDLSDRPNFPINLEGIVSRNSQVRKFNGGILLQRPGLLHTGGFFYAGFGSHCVQYDFSGWVIGWDKSGNIVEKWVTQGPDVPETTRGAGIWMSGGGLASDDAGSIWFGTGNGYASQLATIPVNGFDPPTAMEEAAVRMTQNADGTLSIVNFFMPWEKQALDGADKDLGTSPLQLLPSEFSCGDVRRMGVITGKSGKTYWLNMDDLGGYRNGKGATLDDVIQMYQNENSVYAGAGVYPLEGGYIYVNVIQYPTHVFKFSCSDGVPSFTKVADSPNVNAYTLGVSHGTVTTLDGKEGTGLLWNCDVQEGNLRIYDAVPVDGKLNLIKSFDVTGSTKFTRAVFGDGRLYMGTTLGTFYGFGSPTTSPLECTTNLDFGPIDISSESSERDVTCTALIDVTVSNIALQDGAHFKLTNVPTVPLQVAANSKFTAKAKFAPSRVGVLSDNIAVDTTNSQDGYSKNTLIRVSGTGGSAGPLLSISPETVTFNGVITGNDPNGVTETALVSNEGRSLLTVTSVQYGESSNGTLQTWNGQGSIVFGKFTIQDIPTTIAADSSKTVTVLFDSSTDGTFHGYVKFITDGGEDSFNIEASAGPAPVAVVEFQTPDGTGWVKYDANTHFTFGQVYQNTALSLKLRVTNGAPQGGVQMSLTVSKPPFGIDSIVQANNQVDLAEGTTLAPGESATAVLTCAVPKSQINVDSYNGTAPWTMNINDPDFSKQTMHFDCDAVAQQAPPLLDNGQGKFRYVGCYKENNPGRQLSTQLYGSDTNEGFMCINACENGDYIFCGTQYHRECWAGNTVPNLKVDDKNCNFDCSGDLNQICGGDGVDGAGIFISLFADSLRWDENSTEPLPPGGPYVNPGVLGYGSLGCWTEPASGGRALSQQMSITEATVAKCVALCADREYLYAGLEYGAECWCGDALSSASLSAPDADCGMTCSGNSTEYCGGGSRLNVYKYGASFNGTNPDNSTTTATPTSVSTVSSSAITTTTATATEPAQPTIKSRVGEWVFEACWDELADGRVLSARTEATDDMTLEKCANFCSGMAYFGVEYGRECYCDDSLREGSTKADDPGTCSLTCAGDESTYCGGSMRLQLYKHDVSADSGASSTPVATPTSGVSSTTPASASSSKVDDVDSSPSSASSSTPGSSSGSSSSSIPSSTSTPGPSSSSTAGSSSESESVSSTPSKISSTSSTTTPTSASSTPTGPIVYPGNQNFTYYSCVEEPSAGRLMDDQIYNNGDNMTIKSCLERCWEYDWAGVEYGRECWCGDKLNLEGETDATPGKNVTDSECSFLCPGDDMAYCGAASRLSLYIKKELAKKLWEESQEST